MTTALVTGGNRGIGLAIARGRDADGFDTAAPREDGPTGGVFRDRRPIPW